MKIVAVIVVLLAWPVSPLWAGAMEDATAGVAAAHQGRLDRAIALLTSALASGELSHHNRAVAHSVRGLAYGGKGHFEEAIADFSQTIKLKPGYGTAYYTSGCSTGQVCATQAKARPQHVK